MSLGVLNIVYMYPSGGIQLSPTTATTKAVSANIVVAVVGDN